MLKLITCDIDGTLVKNYTDPINPKLFTLIEDFSKKGVLFVATSGRQLYNLKEIFAPVKDKISYIAENGAIIFHKNHMLFKSAIDLSLAKPLAEKILEKEGVELFLCGEETTYIKPKDEKFFNHVGKEIQNDITVINSFDDIKQDIVKISIFAKEGLTEDIINYFVKDFGKDFKHCVSGALWYDFMKPDTHKGNAIKILQKELNVSWEETASFGDNFNDIEMLSDAKYSYAMEDAHEDVKKVANYTCTDVVETLQELYNKFFSN